MSEEKKENQESNESVDQEELASQWEQQTDEEIDQEDLAAQWEQESSSDVNQEDLAAKWEEEALKEEKSSIDKSLPSFENHQRSENSRLSMLMDIPLEVTVEIGSTQIPIEELLKLNPNSVIELDKLISEPIDLKVNGKLIAKGELYTVKNSFGIKITDIITPEDRMKIIEEE